MGELVQSNVGGRLRAKVDKGTPPPLASDGNPADPQEGFITVQAEFTQAQIMLHAPSFALVTVQELGEALMNWAKENNRDVEGSQVRWTAQLVARVPEKKPMPEASGE